MDGQNFQNENEQVNGTDPVAQEVVAGAAPENTAAQDSYQNNTYQDNTYTSNTYQDNTYTSNSYAGSSDNSYQSSIVTPSGSGSYQDNTANYNTYTTSDSANVYGEADAPKTPGASVASLVLGILGILFSCCCGVGCLFGIIGLILAIVGNKDHKTGVGTGGLVCSIIAIVLSILAVISTFAMGGMESVLSQM